MFGCPAASCFAKCYLVSCFLTILLSRYLAILLSRQQSILTFCTLFPLLLSSRRELAPFLECPLMRSVVGRQGGREYGREGPDRRPLGEGAVTTVSGSNQLF